VRFAAALMEQAKYNESASRRGVNFAWNFGSTVERLVAAAGQEKSPARERRAQVDVSHFINIANDGGAQE
jgi:hypothetical protein